MNINETEWMEGRIAQLHALIARHNYKGHDPFDLPNSPLLSWLPATWRIPQLLLSKFGSRIAPDWVRQSLRVPPIPDPKIYSCCYFAYRLLGAEWDHAAETMLQRLVAMAGKSASDDTIHWGYDYTWGTLYDGVNPRRASTLVPGAFAMLALLHEVIAFSGENYRQPLEQALRWYASRHRRVGNAGAFLGYFTTSTINTHNANVLGCLALSIGGKLVRNEGYLTLAAEATETTLAAVRADGYIPYNDHSRGGWTDCFHHLYVVAALQGIAATNPFVDQQRVGQKVGQMIEYYRQQFLRKDGLVNYFPNRLHPIDPHNYAATAIFMMLADSKQGSQHANALLRRLDESAWDSGTGSYIYRQHPGKNDTRLFLRWTQVWMLFALSAARNPERLNEQLKSYTTLTEPAK
ncbi:MAG: hypothetical protein K1X90_10240 [Candidatus Kapabacteria bacterium]|nr:hypothetical protein [Candidatus Kapabacteria bacterium]